MAQELAPISTELTPDQQAEALRTKLNAIQSAQGKDPVPAEDIDAFLVEYPDVKEDLIALDFNEKNPTTIGAIAVLDDFLAERQPAITLRKPSDGPSPVYMTREQAVAAGFVVTKGAGDQTEYEPAPGFEWADTREDSTNYAVVPEGAIHDAEPVAVSGKEGVELSDVDKLVIDMEDMGYTDAIWKDFLAKVAADGLPDRSFYEGWDAGDDKFQASKIQAFGKTLSEFAKKVNGAASFYKDQVEWLTMAAPRYMRWYKVQDYQKFVREQKHKREIESGEWTDDTDRTVSIKEATDRSVTTLQRPPVEAAPTTPGTAPAADAALASSSDAPRATVSAAPSAVEATAETTKKVANESEFEATLSGDGWKKYVDLSGATDSGSITIKGLDKGTPEYKYSRIHHFFGKNGAAMKLDKPEDYEIKVGDESAEWKATSQYPDGTLVKAGTETRLWVETGTTIKWEKKAPALVAVAEPVPPVPEAAPEPVAASPDAPTYSQEEIAKATKSIVDANGALRLEYIGLQEEDVALATRERKANGLLASLSPKKQADTLARIKAERVILAKKYSDLGDKLAGYKPHIVDVQALAFISEILPRVDTRVAALIGPVKIVPGTNNTDSQLAEVVPATIQGPDATATAAEAVTQVTVPADGEPVSDTDNGDPASDATAQSNG